VSSFAAAALEGDFCDRLAEIARACGRRLVGDVQQFDGWGPVAPLASRPNHLAAAVSGNWTVLVDDWEVTAHLFDRPEVATGLAARYGTRVVGAFAHSVTGGCGYRVHTPAGSRAVVIDQDRVVEDAGEPLPGEDTTDLHQHDMYSVLDVLALLGLDVADGVEASTRCAIVRLAPRRGKRTR
jgi:hypothetical protein